MNAIVIRQPGDVENLRFETVPAPSCEPHQVLVRNNFVGVNFGDVIRRVRGWSGPSPFILGFEGTGTVEAIGHDVMAVKPGDRVGYLATNGAYAELTAVSAQNTFPLPDDLPQSVITAAICTGTTAWSLIELSELKAGETALVHGGAGGVGASLLQLANSLQIRTVAVVGGPEKAAYANSAGANVVIRHDIEDFADRVLEETSGLGAAAVFDCVGDATVDGNVRTLKKNGAWIYYGSTSGHAAFPGDAVLSQGLKVIGFVVFHTLAQPEKWRTAVEGVIQALRDGVLAPRVEVFPGNDVRRVHELLEQRELIGKAVLDFRTVRPSIGGDS